jgi:hypothetical protein
MANLPPERLAVGFEIVPPSPSDQFGPDRRLPFDPVIRFRMASPSGVLIDDEHSLNEWVLSSVGSNGFPVFAYCGGRGDNWNEESGTAWGCVFKPEAGQRYTAILEIVRPDPRTSGYRVKLLIQGGSGLAS